jgi:hypothetical protein
MKGNLEEGGLWWGTKVRWCTKHGKTGWPRAPLGPGRDSGPGAMGVGSPCPERASEEATLMVAGPTPPVCRTGMWGGYPAVGSWRARTSPELDGEGGKGLVLFAPFFFSVQLPLFLVLLALCSDSGSSSHPKHGGLDSSSGPPSTGDLLRTARDEPGRVRLTCTPSHPLRHLGWFGADPQWGVALPPASRSSGPSIRKETGAPPPTPRTATRPGPGPSPAPGLARHPPPYLLIWV